MILFEWNWLYMKFNLRSTSTLYLILMKNWLSSLFWSNSLGMLRQVSLCKLRDIGTLNRFIVAFQHGSWELSCYNFFTLFINPGSNNIVCYWFSHKCLICFVMSVCTNLLRCRWPSWCFQIYYLFSYKPQYNFSSLFWCNHGLQGHY